MHTVINVDEMVPKMVWFKSAATHDHYLLEKLKFDPIPFMFLIKGITIMLLSGVFATTKPAL